MLKYNLASCFKQAAIQSANWDVDLISRAFTCLDPLNNESGNSRRLEWNMNIAQVTSVIKLESPIKIPHFECFINLFLDDN